MHALIVWAKRAARELYNWSKAKHVNILELLGVAIFRDQLAMVSPWMENGTLSSYVSRNPGANRWELVGSLIPCHDSEHC
jgi:hypothetical protein